MSKARNARNNSCSAEAPSEDTPITQLSIKQLRAALGLEDLRDDIAYLRTENQQLKNEIADLKSSIPSGMGNLPAEVLELKNEVAQIRAARENVQPETSIADSAAKSNTRSTLPPDDGRAKYRIRVTGIKEQPNELQLSATIQKDKEAIIDVLQNIDCGSPSICDIYRRGRRNDKQTRARPLVVEFSSTFDKHKVLSKTHEIQTHYPNVYINSDLTPLQRELEKKILSKRHELITKQSIQRDRIKIRSLKLYVDSTEITDLALSTEPGNEQ